ncbi:MAG: DUF4058 family protein [Planctomycetota bacterium]
MKSPFPGMDPYLESHWGDVHTHLMVYASNQLNSQLPGDLQASVEEAVAVIEENEPSRTRYPDVRVSEQPETAGGTAVATVAVTVAEPYRVIVQDEPQTWRHIEIVDSGGRVITAIEFLSPGNKVGSQAQLNYIQKQREFLNARINLVEIDLIRAGNYVLALPEDRLPAACRSSYLVCVRRAAQRNAAEVYPMPLRQPLLNIRVPLRPTDDDVVLRLQELIDDSYRDGRYARLDYRLDPVPRLGESDASWINSILREKGLR